MATKIHRWAKSLRQRKRGNQRTTRSRLLNLEALERRTLLAANVITDQPDYAPGDTAQILATGYQFGETIRFQVLHNDGTPNTGSGHLPWQIADGGSQDLDGRINGQVQTTWYVNPDDSAGSTFILTATGLTSGLTDFTFFADSSNLDQYANKPPAHYQNGNLNSTNSAYTEGSSIPYRYLVGDATEDHRVYVDIVYEFQAALGGPYSIDYLTDDEASETLSDAERFGGTPGDFGLTSCTNPLSVIIPGDNSTSLDGTGPNGVGSFEICSSVPITLVSATHEGATGNTKTIRLVLDLGNDGVANNESDVDFAIFWGGHLARDTDYPGLNDGAGDLSGGSAFHMEVQAFQDNDNSGTRTGGDTNLNTGRVSAQPDVVVDTSMAWEKRRDDTRVLQGGATFVISPNPLTGTGTLSLVDNGFLDADPDPGQFLLPDVRFGTYTITEVAAPTGFAIDDYPSRTVSVSINTPVVSVGTQGVIDQGNTNTSDFFNIPLPQITLSKVTVDGATSGDGLTILTGEPISWRYTVTNPSSVELSNVTLIDDMLGNITSFTGDDGDGKLDPGEIWIFTKTGLAVTGDYANSATVTGRYVASDGTPYESSATDDSSYFGANPQIAIDKVTTHGGAAGDGITAEVGEVVGWRYSVTNAGNVALANVTVTDSVGGVTPAYQSGDTDSDGKLDLGETWIYTASGIAIAGDYSNLGTASGSFTDTAGHTRTDTASDGSSYFGGDPRIQIDKVTVDGATSGDGLTILTGEAITWQYTVTNLGNTALQNVTVADSRPGVVPVYQSGDTDGDSRLDVTETWIYTASGTAVAGNYNNNGVVDAVFVDSNGDQHTTSAADSSSYFGARPEISIDKLTTHGGVEGDGLNVVVGESIGWRYTVTNTGNIALSNVTVTDSRAGVTPAYVSGDTNGDGKLDRDETWIYSATGTAVIGDYSNTGTASGNFTDDAGHTRADSDSDGSSYFGANPQINIVKVTQEGAVSGDGITVLAGELISWQYTVTNVGNVPLANITVKDVPLGPISNSTGDTNGDGLLDLSETWVFTFTGTAEEGNHVNTGTARGTYTDSAGHVHDDTDSDGSSYFGANPQISILKDTIDGTSAGDGANILVGEAIQWRYTVTNVGNVPLSNVAVTDSQAGVTPVRVSGDTNGNNQLDLTETWIYTASSTAAAGNYANTGTASGRFTDDAKDTRTDTASDGSSYFGANPQIAIDKQTRHGGASGDGLTIAVGEALSWRYVVTNVGNVPLSNVTVTDSQAGVTPIFQNGDTDGDSQLDQGETWVYLANGTAVAGNYANTGTATGDFTDTAGHTRADSASDDSSYFGGQPEIAINKVTVDDTSAGDGRRILSGEAILWRYTVTNVGTTTLLDVTVTDSEPGVTPVFVSGDTNGNNQLETTETWIYEATGVAQVGNYVNNGMVTAVFIDSNEDRHPTDAADASSYFGADPQISIDKVTEHGGVQGDGLRVVVGEAISWQYTVTNTGNVSLANVTVTDNQAGVTPILVSGDTNTNNRLDLGETWIYTATGTAVQDSYANTGTARGTFTDAAGHTRADTDTDNSSYFGANPQIHIDKVTVDGGSAGDGRTILVGEAITWRYTVTNEGNVPLANVAVNDSHLGSITSFTGGDTNNNGLLDLNETWVFTASGTAAAGSQANTGVVRGDYIDSASEVHFDTDSDDSSYFGADPQIAIAKVTVDAATAGDGLDILVGESIRWRYTVTNVGNIALSNVSVTDSQTGVTPVFQSGDANGNSRLDLGEVWTYIATGTVGAGSYTNVGRAQGRFTDAAGHTRSDAANDSSSYFGANPQIAINKVTVDGSSAGDGRSILVGENIRWRYTVTNAGNVPLANVTVTDSMAGVTPIFQSGDANGNNLLDLGETWFFAADGTAAAGTYTNTGTARGSFADTAGHARTGTAADDSSYFGADPQISVGKVTVDGASAGDGRRILAGEPIRWRYTVTNVGNVSLANVIVTDSQAGVTPVFQSGDANGNSRLDRGEAWTFIATGTAQAGLYSNTGTAAGRFTDAAGHTRIDQSSDPSSYFGVAPAIDLQKLVNGLDADTAPGPTILFGSPVVWTYVVRNTGNAPLAGVAVTDDNGTPGDASDDFSPTFQSGDFDGDGLLDVNETWRYRATGTAIIGDYRNIGRVTASVTDTAQHVRTVTDSDPANYRGHRNVIVIVPDKGNESTPLVRVIDRDSQQVLSQFLAYESSFRGGVRVATGDIDNDGVDEIITAPQRGRAPEVRVFEQDGTELVKYRTMAYSPSFLGGVNLAVGDIDGNKTTDIVVAPNYGAMPVEVFYNTPAASDPLPNTPSRSFFAFSNQFLGGADVAVADVGTFANGSIVNALVQDGKAEIIVGSGPGMAAIVKVYDLTGAPAVVDTIKPLRGSFTGGMSLQAGRVNSDAIPDILVAAGDLGGSRIEIWSGIANDSPDVLLEAFAAFGDVSSSNVHVHAALLDQNGDGRADGILAAQGTNGTSGQLRFFNVDGSGMQAWSGYPGGWMVASLSRPSPSLPSAISASLDEAEEAVDKLFAAWGDSDE